jgi:hypothetical protein
MSAKPKDFSTMSILPQPSLFSWQEVEATSEISRLTRLLDVLPDADLLAALEVGRAGKRNDYPLAALWRALLAGIVFGHASLASLGRELARNGQLRDLCGFDPLRGDRAVPPGWVWTRFIVKLLRHGALVDAMFERLVERLGERLSDFGRDLAADGKAVGAWSRLDPEASEGFKNYEGEDDQGDPLQKIQKWFGYKLHLIVDANYELPVAFELSGAKEAESPRLMPMIERLEAEHPALAARVESLAADRGYDDGADKAALFDDHGIVPLIDTRDLHRGAMQPLDEKHHDTIYFSPTGEVACKVDPFEPQPEKAFAAMQFMGFEKKRGTLKFRCPAAAFGLTCKNREACRCAPGARDGQYGRVVRVPLERDRRIFMPLHRHSQGFVKGYNKRTAIERVNSRIDQVYGFEHHFIRSKKKMRLRLGLGLLVMLGTALAWVEAGHEERLRSLVRAA